MSQIITLELKRWILEQARDGHSPESVLAAMQASGWQTDVAIRALEDTLQQHLQQTQAAAAASGGPVGVPVPDLDLTGSPSRIDAGDREVEVIATLGSPRVVVLGGLLSDEECDGLIEAARPRLARSLTVQTQTGGEEANPDRTSQGMFFQRGESELISRIEARIARLVQWPVDHGEGVQVLRYRPGAEYKPHYDYFDPGEPGTPTILRRGGQRVGTLVMYLNQPEQGGGTTFPDIGLEVAPVRGNAVFFSYDRPHPATRTLHGGAPVIAGEKWVATKWLREGVFN
ncbi:MAG: 2-oxoglutarate-dependent dioxygenase [Burkholderiales bacterium]|nr:MAG: 2-oxoglutarate-dependent dioxygenase [Burkholderiales bacterium]